jgi:hypothetical protein
MSNFTTKIATADIKTMKLMASVTKLKNGEDNLEQVIDLIQEIHNDHIQTICELAQNKSNDHIEIFSFMKKPNV